MIARPLRLTTLLATALALTGIALDGAPRARAEPYVFKHDQFSADLATAASTINGGQFYTQPGFVAGEAFGQIYTPLPEMYPLQIVGFDVILAAPPNSIEALYANATIEIYNSDSLTADPGNAPIFTVSTGDLFNPSTQEIGFPLVGNYGIHVDFGQGDPEDRPPMVDAGKLWLVIRFNDAAQDMGNEWGTLQCTKLSDPTFGDLSCGCQNVGTVHDNDIVPKVNVIHHISPIGQCSGSNKEWTYMENIPALSSGFKIDGDVILRLHADVAAGPCVPECSDAVCGDDGCGGSCGTCTGALVCDDGKCVSCIKDCLSKQCGDDGCGGTCGTCGGSQVCGEDFFCHSECAPACSGKECGNDGCGGTCGACDQGEVCQAGQCVTGCARDCDGKVCGDDGCGGTCGTCDSGEACQAGACVAGCTRDCDGKVCGDDGCGGTCGTCDALEVCDDGRCEDKPVAGYVIEDVSPSTTFAGVTTPISITGRGFAEGAAVKVGAADCTDVRVTGSGLISAVVPALTVGSYSVIVINPGGAIATLPDAFEVKATTTTNGGGQEDGCAGGSPPLGVGLAVFALALLARRPKALAKRERPC